MLLRSIPVSSNVSWRAACREKHGRQQREQELRGEYGGALLDVSRDGWERLLTHKQPKRARADEYRDRRGRAKKGPLQPDEWAAPTTQATTHTRDDEGEVEETHAGDDAGDVAAAEAEFQLQGGDEGDIRGRNQFAARVISTLREQLVVDDIDFERVTGCRADPHERDEHNARVEQDLKQFLENKYN
jgi:hypothetical protein